MGDEDPPTTTDPAPGPQPAPTKTGYDYEEGVYRDSTGTTTAYLPTYILTDDDNGFRWGAQPTAETYRRPVLYDDIRPITLRYLATFQVEYGKRYKHYVDYDYSKSTIVKFGPSVGPSWTFTSPYTGNVFTGVLPLTDFYIKDTGEHFYFFVEIFNDYQAYRGYADWDPDIDGPPGVGWIGAVPEFKSFFQANSVPVNLQGVLPVFVHIVDNTAQPIVDTYKYVYSHFGFVGKNRTENPRRYASYSRSIAERDVETSTLPVVQPDTADVISYNAPPTPYGVKGSDPFTTTDANVALNKSTYTAMLNWDIVADQTPLVLTNGQNISPYLSTTTASDGNNFLYRSKNATGYMSRGSNGTYEFWWSTFDQKVPTRTKGQVVSGLNYYSRYAIQAPGQENYSVANKLSWSGNPMTFIGVAWSGTAVTATDGGAIGGTKSAMTNGYGVVNLNSDYFAPDVVCASTKLPNSPNSVPDEFNGVLSVANANVFRVTGLNQCPFVWHAREGFIRYHVFW